MLLRLVVRDVVLIDTLEVSFSHGFVALTGETGAGKSILLDALGLALGQRGDPGLIRQGASQASVVAEFTGAHCHDLLREHGIDPQETLLLKRILQRNGPSRAYINDEPVSVGLLKCLGEDLLEIHGQFDRLLTPATHRGALDTFGGIDVASVREAYTKWRAAQRDYDETQKSHERLEQERAFREAQATELIALNPQAGEEEELIQLRARLSHSQRIEDALTQTFVQLSDTQGALAGLYGAEKALQRIQELLPQNTEPLLGSLGRAIVETSEVQRCVQTLQRELRMDPQQLSEIDDRLHSLRGAARKYGVTTDVLAQLAQEAQERLVFLQEGESIMDQKAREVDQTRETYKAEAHRVHERRVVTKAALETAIHGELPALKLAQVTFVVHLETAPEAQWGEAGLDQVEFYISTNPGQAPASLSKVASGGELARLMLALKVALAQEHQRMTLIFDEIDQGVGGAVAAAIGERLAHLASQCQVMAITHSPQVASAAEQHFMVLKALTDDGLAQTQVRELDEPARREEIARMLSGQEITGEARAAATRLLQRTGT